ncbi:UDP-galactopyranose mutase [Candidatus Pantoea carbekii]|uniref:UDP-galactopyranose mutase n=1 Tax=Candidatus Pantoea carbekii TaxID=1235990 RepID=UPI00130ED5CA
MFIRILIPAFCKKYITKHWNMDLIKFPIDFLRTLSTHFNNNYDYFNHRYQGIPK